MIHFMMYQLLPSGRPEILEEGQASQEDIDSRIAELPDNSDVQVATYQEEHNSYVTIHPRMTVRMVN